METLSLERARRSAQGRHVGDAERIDIETQLPRLQRIARGILRSEDLALDAVQEALVCLWMEAARPADVQGWLVRTVVVRSLHQLRSLDRRRHHETRAVREGRTWREAVDPSLASGGREQRAQIERALSELPHGFGAAFRLREVEGLDYAEIAARLSVPLGTVRSRLNRARALLRERLWSSMHDERACFFCAKESRTRRLRA